MKKFWEWMEKKEYSTNVPVGKHFWLLDELDEICDPTYQMLIGYMIEYLIENKKGGSLVIGLCLDINELYKELKKEIEA